MRARETRSERWLGSAYVGVSALFAGVVVAVATGAYLGSETSSAVIVVAILAGSAALLGAAYWFPGLIFALAPATFIFNTRRGFFPFDLVVLGLAAYALLDAIWRRDLRLPGPRALHLTFLAFLLSGMITLFMAREFVSFGGAVKRILVGYLGLVLVLRYADRERWPWFALSIPVAGTALSLLVLNLYRSRGFLVERAYELRTFYANVGWGASSLVSAVLSLTILGSIILLVLPSRPWLRLVSAIALVPMGLCMALLVSRGTILAVALGLLALLVTIGGRHRWKVLLVGGIGAALFTQLPVFKVIFLRFTLASQSLSYVARIVSWEIALDRFLTHPVLGVGLGQGKFQADELRNQDPHNYFLSVASETGVVGLFAWTALLVALFRTAWVAARGDPVREAWGRALQVFLAIAVLFSCYEPTFANANYFFLFFWIAAVLHRAADPLEATAPRAATPR